MPTVDFTSHLTGYYKVISVYDGDTITIETPIGTAPSLRLVGVDTPEIKGGTRAERNRAIAARDYLRDLILKKSVFIVFEESQTTLDGIRRGPYCRPLSYIFFRDTDNDKNIFVNLEIVWQGHGERYFQYDFDYEDFFRLDQATAQSRIDDLTLIAPVQQSPHTQRKKKLPMVWGQLKSERHN